MQGDLASSLGGLVLGIFVAFNDNPTSSEDVDGVIRGSHGTGIGRPPRGAGSWGSSCGKPKCGGIVSGGGGGRKSLPTLIRLE